MTAQIAIEAVGISPDIMGEASRRISEDESLFEKDFQLYLFGWLEKLEKYQSGNVTVIDAPDFPTTSEEKQRLKKENMGTSLEKTLEFAKENNMIALCLGSTGETKAVMEREGYILKGIKKPVIAAEFPTKEGFNLLVDVGLNPHLEYRFMPATIINGKDLVDFALMAGTYLQCLGHRPTLGFASFNEKYGSKIARNAKKRLKKIKRDWFDINPTFFRGKDLSRGNANVVSKEANAANFILDFTEGFAENFDTQGTKFDESNYGAMPVLGSFPNIFIGHRSSRVEKAANAIKRSILFYDLKDELNEKLVENLS